MPPRNFIDATVSPYGEPETTAERIVAFVFHNPLRPALLFILLCELAFVAGISL